MAFSCELPPQTTGAAQTSYWSIALEGQAKLFTFPTCRPLPISVETPQKKACVSSVSYPSRRMAVKHGTLLVGH
jgi:hypothetical protein